MVLTSSAVVMLPAAMVGSPAPPPDGLSHDGMDQITATGIDQACDLDRLIWVDPALRPIVGGDADQQWPFPGRAHRIEDLERKPHAVLERASVLVAAPIRQRRGKAGNEICAREVA